MCQEFGEDIMRHIHDAPTQISEPYRINGRLFSDYICACGNKFTARTNHVTSGNTISCGCYSGKRTHGKSRTKLYNVWLNMKNRCINPNNAAYVNYGGKGIIVCQSWINDYQAFFDWSMENGYQEGLSIDRVNPEGNYDQSNCRWTDKITQNTNTRLIHITNKSGYRGVSFYAPSQKWRACIQVQNKTHHIGLFVDKKDAALVRDAYIITNKLPHPLNFKVINE